MPLKPDTTPDAADGPGSLLRLAVLSLLAGAVAGLLGAVFRLALAQADRWRDSLVVWGQGEKWVGLLAIVGACALATAAGAWLVRRFSPYASGSGIPHVEAVLNGELPQAPFRLIPVKFAGGLLAIGAGLALGREGPTVQMGASLAHWLGKMFRLNWPDSRVLLAAGAGAGLATAFNAPIAGAIFVLEELVRRFETRIAVAALGASATAICVARLFLGNRPDFHVESLPYLDLDRMPAFLLLGLIAGLLGVAYNRTLLGTLAAADWCGRSPATLRAGLVGAGVGLLAWFAPGLVGGGETLTQHTLAGPEPILTLVLVFLLRFGLGAVSYAAGTPGGLFAPLLVLGAEIGTVGGMLSNMLSAQTATPAAAYGVVGMGAFFTAVVRAPLTGIILVIEMTAGFTLFLPMLVACFGAMLVPTLLRNAPIYDSLRARTLRSDKNPGNHEGPG